MFVEVTIIIPCYNMGDFLLETVKSVDAVIDNSKHEVLIINDGSNDAKTIENLNSIRHKYHIIDQENQGLSAARNSGISNAKGKYLLFLDADNLLTDVYLLSGVNIMEADPELAVVYGISQTFGDATNKNLLSGNFNLQTLMMYNYIDACCLVRKTAFDDVGMFDTKMKSGLEDWEMWLRMAFSQKKFHFLEGQIVQLYRVRPDSMMRSIDKIKAGEILDYLKQKYPSLLDHDAISDFYFSKFSNAPFGWTLKLFIRKYAKSFYQYLIKTGKIRKQL